MTVQTFPGSWAPYMTWAKHFVGARWNLTGSNLLPCTFDDLPGAREALRLDGRNDDGWPPLVDAIAQRFGVDRERVATGPGASGANFLVYAALLRPGDRILTEWPGYDPQPGAARLLGAEVDTFPRGWDRSFTLDPRAIEAALTERTRLVVLTNLHNPSGVYANPDSLRRVGELAESVGAKVLVDEVYLDTIPEVDTTPAAHLGDAFVTTNSLTKSYGLSGLRIGWILADPDTVERVWRVRDVVDGIGSVPSDVLGALAFSRLDALLERARGILRPGFALLRNFVNSRPELDWVEPPGGSIGFPRLLGTDDTEPFIEHAARHFDVSVTPGRLFGEPAHFRIAVSGERETTEAGLEALERALDAWQA